jgi:heme exporter protein A
VTLELLLDAEGLSLVRGGRLLLEGLDLKLAAGDGLQVRGPNGSGKTSLIRLVAGLLQPSSGTIRRQAAALADEHAALDRELPLRRALAFWGGRRLDAAIGSFALDQLSSVPVRLLSSGQLKRASLARVMASAAPIWLLDEPLNGLDVRSADLLVSAVDAHRATGGAVLIASHQPLAGSWRTLELEP